MNAHTIRIMEYMKALLDKYQAGSIGLRTLVDGLEGNINALEEKMPDAFTTQWSIHWGRLEIILAAGTERERQEEIFEAIEALRELLSKSKSELRY